MSLFEQKNSGVLFCFLKNEVTSYIKPASPPLLPWKLYGSRDERNAESLAGLGVLCFSSVSYFSIYKVLGSTTLLQKMILEDEVPHPSLSVTSLAVRVRGRDRRSCVSLQNLLDYITISFSIKSEAGHALGGVNPLIVDRQQFYKGILRAPLHCTFVPDFLQVTR